MFDKRNRWIAVIVMAVATLAFAGVSIILPLTGLFQGGQQAGSTPTPTAASAGSSPKADLAAQARGYELVLQREPDNQTALRGLVDTKIQQGDIKGIIDPLEKLAKLNPNQADYTVLLAQAKQQNGDREGAAQAYRSILTNRPGDLNALKGLTDLLMQQQRPEAAVGLLQDTLKTADQANQVQPGSVDVTSVQLLLGQVYATQGRYDEALVIYDQAIAGNSKDFRPLLGKAIVLKTQGKNDQSQPLFVSAAALAPAQFKDQINQLAKANPSPSPSAPASPPAPTSEANPSASPEASSAEPTQSPASSPEASSAEPTQSPASPPAGE